MRYWLGLIGLLFGVALLFGQPAESLRLARDCHAKASAYYASANPTDRTDSLALFFYKRALRYAPAGPASAMLVFDCYEKTGICQQVYNRQTEALQNYRQAIAVARRYGLSDSLLFNPYLYGGTSHFYGQSYDSAAYYFERAEALYARFPRLPEARRLFNALGALYHESGNYRQSINYFQKALQLVQRDKEPDNTLVYIYKSNIATALRHLKEYDSAAAIYKSLLSYGEKPDKIYTNLGMVYLSKRQPAEALQYLMKVKIDSTNGLVVKNALAESYLLQTNYSQATTILNESLSLANRYQATRTKDSHLGHTYKLLGDLAFRQKRYQLALQHYQRSIIQHDLSFHETDVYQNPVNYVQGFGSYDLFESLTAKAECWRAMHEQSGDEQYRQAAIETYRSAFRLSDYVEKSFDNEEARLFSGQKVYPVYQRAVIYLVQAYEQSGRDVFLEEAFRWSEKSKAAALAIGLKENAIKSMAGIPDTLLRQERDLRFALSRLMIQRENAPSGPDQDRIASQLRDTELNLSRLSDKLHDYPDYYRLKFSFDSVSVQQLQKTVLTPQTALLSYFRADTALFGFVLTRTQLHYFRVPQPQTLDIALNGLLQHVQIVKTGRAFGGKPYAESLYNKLIAPAEAHLRGISSLIVIPHNELSRLPFEALHDYQHQYLLERFDVTYQYAASFLQSRVARPPDLSRMLAVAPFDGPQSLGGFTPLTASRDEVSELKGLRLLNSRATKSNFLQSAGEYPIIHLATHAVANNQDPTRSFVAFYPTNYANNRLYAHELSYGTLAKTELVFLSACETASGKLVQGEGVMSLSRAFSFAGCSNLITSLWKAEDNATAYISRRFYKHLADGLPFAKALQQAKLDLLHDRREVQFHSPQYWSHLIYIGSPPRTGLPWTTYLWGVLAVAGVGGLGWLWRKKSGFIKRGQRVRANQPANPLP